MFNQFLRNGPRQASDETKRKIVRMLNGGDSSIHMDKLKISLKCPIMKTRMKIPARSKICSHIQCFDLQNFLQLNEQTSTWKCPFCNGNASYDNLIIDQYFMSVLTAIKNLNVEEIELLQNGKWKTIGESGSNTNISDKNVEVINLDEDEIVTLDDSNVGSALLVRNSRTSRTNNTAPRTSRKANSSEIITLVSNDGLFASKDEDIIHTLTNVNVPIQTKLPPVILTIAAMFIRIDRFFNYSR